MRGLMMHAPLTITSIMRHADRVNGAAEVVSVTAEDPRHRFTFAEVFRRARQLAQALVKAALIKSGGEWISSIDLECVAFVEMTPRTVTGKIFKVELRRQFKDFRFDAGT